MAGTSVIHVHDDEKKKVTIEETGKRIVIKDHSS
jgi:hypothetical protein